MEGSQTKLAHLHRDVHVQSQPCLVLNDGLTNHVLEMKESLGQIETAWERQSNKGHPQTKKEVKRFTLDSLLHRVAQRWAQLRR